MDRNGLMWTEMDQNVNVIQNECNNNKCYASTFRYYYIDLYDLYVLCKKFVLTTISLKVSKN